ncbi:hypothetical protein [Chryseobacterium indoltheticum]|uniref:hypothetical protein n=1 Tax=Chryseobacterium indoltheticum TaxID=254 RepID=UPI003F491C4B
MNHKIYSIVLYFQKIIWIRQYLQWLIFINSDADLEMGIMLQTNIIIARSSVTNMQ